MTISRRQLVGAASVSGLAAAGATRWWPAAAAPSLPAPEASGIEHVVVVMMENRSFDHYLGWLPGADGKQEGLSYVDRRGVRHETHHLTAYDGCGFEDPDHSWEGGRIQLNGGRLDGFLKSGENDLMAIGYYTDADLAFYARAAREWTVFDRYFSAVMAETYPNRFYQHAAQTDRLHNNTDKCTLPTIWDRLQEKGLTGTYYYSDIPFTALWYEKHLDISTSFATFLLDAAAGTLPAVSFVDPRFLDEEGGRSNDDHPLADIRAGQAFLNSVYDALRTSPAWEKTVLVINYDEWGGFYDHVPAAPGARRVEEDRAARLPGPGAADLAAGAPRPRLAPRLRPHLGAQDDRVALGAAAADPARPQRAQHGRGARLRQRAGHHARRRTTCRTPRRSAATRRSRSPTSGRRSSGSPATWGWRSRDDPDPVRVVLALALVVGGLALPTATASLPQSPPRQEAARGIGAYVPPDAARVRDQHREQGLRQDVGRRTRRRRTSPSGCAPRASCSTSTTGPHTTPSPTTSRRSRGRARTRRCRPTARSSPTSCGTTTVEPDQAVGTGCVFPADVPTLPRQLTDAGRTWKGYMDDMAEPCQHPDVGRVDPTQKATAEDNYAARHNPFVYFHSIIDHPTYCKRHVVGLGHLRKDLRRVRTTPNLAYITPDLCHDGHDAPCADGRPGGLTSVNAFMKKWVPLILDSRAFKKNGVLIITADESDGPQSDADACCGPATSVNSPMPGITGPGGGKIGALVISKYVKPGSWSTSPYNHYSLLGSIEEIFRLPKLGYARDADVETFGLDVYNDYR